MPWTKPIPNFPYLGSHTQPEYNTITAVDGQTLYYSLHKPRNFDPDKQYPVISKCMAVRAYNECLVIGMYLVIVIFGISF